VWNCLGRPAPLQHFSFDAAARCSTSPMGGATRSGAAGVRQPAPGQAPTAAHPTAVNQAADSQVLRRTAPTCLVQGITRLSARRRCLFPPGSLITPGHHQGGWRFRRWITPTPGDAHQKPVWQRHGCGQCQAAARPFCLRFCEPSTGSAAANRPPTEAVRAAGADASSSGTNSWLFVILTCCVVRANSGQAKLCLVAACYGGGWFGAVRRSLRRERRWRFRGRRIEAGGKAQSGPRS